jgi:hypothetical protein
MLYFLNTVVEKISEIQKIISFTNIITMLFSQVWPFIISSLSNEMLTEQ